VVRNLCANVETDSKLFLNAPDYLFVSTNVAKKFPDLMESILVQAYTTHLPGELARKWQVGSVARAQRYQRLRRVTLLGSVMATLQYLGTAPFVMQRLFIRFVQPFAFSALVLMWQLIISDTVYIIVAVVLLVAAIAYGVYRYSIDRAIDHVKQVAPVSAEYQSTAGSQNAASGAHAAADDSSQGSLNLPSPTSAAARKAHNQQAGSASNASEEKSDEKDTHSELSSIVSHTLDRRAVPPKRAASGRSSITSMSEVSSADLPASGAVRPGAFNMARQRVPYIGGGSSSSDSASVAGCAPSLQSSASAATVTPNASTKGPQTLSGEESGAEQQGEGDAEQSGDESSATLDIDIDMSVSTDSLYSGTM
jgi:hypothetical protein